MIYLASSSPRRKVLLRQAGIHFKTVLPAYAENNLRKLPARKLVMDHALGKALSAPVQDGVVLAADTLVFLGSRVIGKPRNKQEAERILGSLQGRRHTVWTGVAILEKRSGKVIHKKMVAEKTTVRIKPMSPAAIRAYFRKINPLDKAGAYAIQSKHSIVEAVSGSLSNAVGLPMERLRIILSRLFPRFLR